MVKRIILIPGGLLLLTLLAWAGIFYWKNLRGVGPSIKNPPKDVTAVLHTTGMPLELSEDFSIGIFARDLVAPRVLASDPEGTLLTSIPSQGRVVALPDRDKNGVADETVTVVEGLHRPHGLAFRCDSHCTLYVAESNGVSSYHYDPATLKATNLQRLIDLPDGGRHVTRTLLFLPSPNVSTLLVSVGSSCDTCMEADERRAAVLAVDVTTRATRMYATGLRNAVFMTLHPQTQQVWATEMGRDFLGDHLPPDEVNIIEDGRFYGWPWCYGKNVHDKKFDARAPAAARCAQSVPSLVDLPAHSAPLGLAFIPQEGWPEEYRNDLLVAYHGSWNSTTPVGYNVVRFDMNGGKNVAPQSSDFISGWLTKEGALGRPVDLLAAPGGVIYVSDDKAGVIYRVTYAAD